MPGADLGTVSGSSRAYSINDLGQVTGGDANNLLLNERAFRTTATGGVTTASILAAPANTNSVGYGINASGQVTGYFAMAGGNSHAFRTTATGDLTDPNADLGTLGGASSGGIAINASGQVTGDSATADGHNHAFRTTATGNLSDPAADLGVLPGYAHSMGWGINSLGVVVGDSQPASGNSHAFIYDTQMRDLNDLIPANSGWVLGRAFGINDLGWIVGNGTLNGEGHAFLLTPVAVPEPSALLLAGAAAAGAWAARWARKRL